MQRINTPDEKFHAGDPSTGALGTIVTSDYMQSLQEEVAGAIEGTGAQLDGTKTDQLFTAIKSIFTSGIAAGIQIVKKICGVNSPNLLYNGSGELGNAGWASSNFGAAVDSVSANGTLFTNAAAITAGASLFDESIDIPCGPNVALNLSAALKSPTATAGNSCVSIVAYDAAHALLGVVAATGVLPFGSSLTFQTANGVTPANTASVRIRKVADGNPRAPIGGFVFERIKLESGGTPSTYSQEANFTQSTETIPGSAKIATQALTNAGVDDATVVTPKKLRAGFAFSVGAIGYIAFPTWLGGLIIQWGQTACAAGATSSTTFPLAFPTLCLNVVACGYQATGNTQSYTTVNSRSATSFGWSGFLAAGGSAPVLAATAGSVVAWWIAIGY